MDLVKRIGVSLTVLCLHAAISGVQAAPPTHQSVDAALDQWQTLMQDASQRFAIPVSWLRAVMRAESAGQAIINGTPTTSSAGAMSLMQIMPATWAELSDRYGLGNDPYQPRANILAGAAYLRQMLDRYGWPLCFAAYHAGPSRVDAYLTVQGVLPDATLGYVAKVTGVIRSDTKMMIPVTTASALFFAVGDRKMPHAMTASQAFEQRLFAPLTHGVQQINDYAIGSGSTQLEGSHVQVP